MTTIGDGQLNRRGSMVRNALATSLVAAVLSGSALVGSASAAVTGGQTIEAFIGTNLVGLSGYGPGEEVRLEVIRNGAVIGHATKTAGTTGENTGFIEINHGGTADNDCFDSPNTPNIRPGDRLQTTGPVSGTDFEIVRDLGIKFNRIITNTNTNKITVSGHARGTVRAPIVPKRDVLELRLNKGSADTWDTGRGLDQDRPGRKDLRVDIGRKLDAQGNFTRVLKVSHNDALDWKRNPGEVFLEWSKAVGEAAPPAIFVADTGPGRAAGCPPLAG